MKDIYHKCPECGYEWVTVYKSDQSADFRESCPECGWVRKEEYATGRKQ